MMSSKTWDYPIEDMLNAAERATSKSAAVWAALKVLERTGGYVILPTSGGGGRRAAITNMARRWKRRVRHA